jgi:hypothetical protein
MYSSTISFSNVIDAVVCINHIRVEETLLSAQGLTWLFCKTKNTM